MADGDDLGPSGECEGFSVNYPARDHRGHNHNAISHTNRIRDVDLMALLNPGARYFGESQYIVPHEYVDGNGNQNNNVVYREYSVVGPSSSGAFGFSTVGDSVQEAPAVSVWAGVNMSLIEPAPLEDGQAFLAYETTDLGDGLNLCTRSLFE